MQFAYLADGQKVEIFFIIQEILFFSFRVEEGEKKGNKFLLVAAYILLYLSVILSVTIVVDGPALLVLIMIVVLIMMPCSSNHQETLKK